MSTGFGTKGGRTDRAHCAVVSVVACEKVKTQGMFGPVWHCVPGCDFDVVILSDPWLRLLVGFHSFRLIVFVFFNTILTVTWAHIVLCCVCTDESCQLKTSLHRSWIVPPPTLLGVLHVAVEINCD